MNINLNYYINNPRNITIIIYILIIVLILYSKPKCMFDNNYKMKKLGFKKDNTFIPYYFICIIIALLLYYIVLYFFKIINN